MTPMKASFSRIINAETPVLVDFYADWCAPCKMLSPVLKDVKETLGDQVKIVKIDVDKNSAIASRFQVRGGPHPDPVQGWSGRVEAVRRFAQTHLAGSGPRTPLTPVAPLLPFPS